MSSSRRTHIIASLFFFVLLFFFLVVVVILFHGCHDLLLVRLETFQIDILVFFARFIFICYSSAGQAD